MQARRWAAKVQAAEELMRGGQLEDGRSGELKESTWPGRSEHGLETGAKSNVKVWR